MLQTSSCRPDDFQTSGIAAVRNPIFPIGMPTGARRGHACLYPGYDLPRFCVRDVDSRPFI